MMLESFQDNFTLPPNLEGEYNSIKIVKQSKDVKCTKKRK